jgi:hypothetical protein
MFSRGKACCQLRDIPQELVYADRTAVTVCEYRVIAISA